MKNILRPELGIESLIVIMQTVDFSNCVEGIWIFPADI